MAIICHGALGRFVGASFGRCQGSTDILPVGQLGVSPERWAAVP